MRLIDADELRLSHCKECTLYPDKCLKDKCDRDSIYHIDHAKTVEAIPTKFLREWFGDNYNAFTDLQEAWEKEKENNERWQLITELQRSED